MEQVSLNPNRITDLFSRKRKAILNVYFTAGFPERDATLPILRSLQQAGADLVEIGIPYSDPVADGQTIQQSSQCALKNGMSLTLLFEQLAECRQEITLPVILMGYLNPVLQFGVENFCKKCREVGVDGVILPDLPVELFQREYGHIFRRYGVINICLITPLTTEHRIRLIDEQTEGFIYMVSSTAITGSELAITTNTQAYFNRVQSMNLKNPRLIGFGINDYETFSTACQYANGAIVGSAFIRHLQQQPITSPLAREKHIKEFIDQLRSRNSSINN